MIVAFKYISGHDLQMN